MKLFSVLCVFTLFGTGLQAAAHPENCDPCPLPQMIEIQPPPQTYFTEEWGGDLIDFSVFPISSEVQIGKIQHLIQRVPCGLYLTVGGERGFRAASMSKKITALYMLDIHEDIIRYNRINRELLKTPHRKDYLHLRWESSFAEWQALFEDVHTKYGHPITVVMEDYAWWNKNIRDLNRGGYVLPETLNKTQSFSCRHEAPLWSKKLSVAERTLDLGKVLDFKTGNYLFYDDLYARLHTLALGNRIYTSQINLLDQSQVTQLIEYIEGIGFTLSVLDFDNLYFHDYLGQDLYHRLIPQFLPLGKDSSVLLVMKNYKDYACGQFQIYIGFTFENVAHWPADFRMEDFAESIPSPVFDLINGRLYEGHEMLPQF